MGLGAAVGSPRDQQADGPEAQDRTFLEGSACDHGRPVERGAIARLEVLHPERTTGPVHRGMAARQLAIVEQAAELFGVPTELHVAPCHREGATEHARVRVVCHPQARSRSSVRPMGQHGTEGARGVVHATRIPPMEHLGPYRLLGPLGAGGMGQVWRAESYEGVQVAVKSVRTSEPGHRAALRRELALLASLRHPGIVRLVEVGESEDGPWYAMELLDAPTMAQWMGSERDAARTLDVSTLADDDDVVQEPVLAKPAAAWQAVVDLAWQLADALAFLHGEGLVHGDLKPSNVIVAEGRPVLVDFGLASSVDAAVPTTGGSAPWMAPERIQGGALDGRADLYALGVILFEGLTGRRPFTGATVGAVLEAHLEVVPPRVEGVPHDVADVVQELLRKRPADRPGWADEVAARLGPYAAQTVGPSTRPRRHLLQSALVGRSAVQAALGDAVDNELGRLIVGAPGTGRTRLLATMARAARRQHREVISIHAAGPAPLAAMREALGTLFDHSGEARPPDNAVGEWLWAQRRGGVQAPALPPGSAGPVRQLLHRMLDAVPRPALVLADDEDQLDALSQAWVRELLRHPPDGIAVLAAGAEPVEGIESVELKPLSRELSGDVLDGMLGAPAPEHVRTVVLDTSRGRPAEIAGLLTAWLRDGVLDRVDGRWRWPDGQALHSVGAGWVTSVSARLGPEAAAALDALAVLETGTASEIAAVARLSQSVTEAGLSRLLAEGWVTLRGTRLSIPDTLRRELEARLSEARAVELAARACGVLAEMPHRVADRARLLDRAGQSADAGWAWWETGQIAHALSDLRGAADAWDKAAERLPEHSDHLQTFRATYATVEFGEHAQAERDLRAVVDGSGRPFDRQAALGGLGRLLWRTARVDEAEQCFRARLEACDDNPMQRATALADLGSLMHERGELDAALQLAQDAVRTLDEVEERHILPKAPFQRPHEELVRVNRVVFLGNVGTALLGLRRDHEAMDVLRRASELADELPDWRVRLLPLRGSHAVALLRLGEYAAARPRFQRVLSDAQAAGDALNECVTWQFLARLAFLMGEDPEPWLVPGLQLADSRNYVLQQGTLWGLRSEAAERRGDLAAAAHAAQMFEHRARRFQGDGYILTALCRRSAIARAQGDLENAYAWITEARALRSEPVSFVMWATERGLVAHAMGEDPSPWLAEAEAAAEGLALRPGDVAHLEALRRVVVS